MNILKGWAISITEGSETVNLGVYHPEKGLAVIQVERPSVRADVLLLMKKDLEGAA